MHRCTGKVLQMQELRRQNEYRMVIECGYNLIIDKRMWIQFKKFNTIS